MMNMTHVVLRCLFDENMREQLMTAIRHDQKDQVLHIVRSEPESFSDTDLMDAMRCAVQVQNKDILLSLIRKGPNCYFIFRDNFHTQTWKDSLKPESNQKGADGEEIFWIFDTLNEQGERDLAMLVAATYPEKILINQRTWPEMIPKIDAWICFCFKYFTGDDMSRVDALTGEPTLTSLKKWCVENCHANMALYLAAITQDLELVETMVSTQTILRVRPLFLYVSIVFILDDRRADRKRGYSVAVALLKDYPLNEDSVQFVPEYIYGLERVAKVCKDQGLLDWALLLTSDFTYVRRHYKSCRNQNVLNRILEKAVSCQFNEWEFVSELLPGCSNIRTLHFLLVQAFWRGRIKVAKEIMSRVDPSTCTTYPHLTLLIDAVECEACNSQDTVRHLVHLCIASGLSTLQRSLTIPRNACYFFRKSRIPKLRIMKLLVESGTFTHGTLHELSRKMQSVNGTSEEEKKCYRYIQEAAATPCSLQHLARLTVSHSTGCQPGRSERIQALPLPNKLKCYLKFEDVLAADTVQYKLGDKEK